MDKTLENEIKKFMAQKLAEGEKLSDLQDAVNRTEEIASATAQNSESISAAVQQQTAGMDEISSGSERMAKAAETLKNEIASFQLREET